MAVLQQNSQIELCWTFQDA